MLSEYKKWVKVGEMLDNIVLLNKALAELLRELKDEIERFKEEKD